VVRGVDSSLLDEWEALAHPDPDELDPDAVRPPSRTAAARGITANERAFTVMVRNALFRRVELLATRRHDMLGELDTSRGWPAHVWADAMAAYWDEYPDLGIGAHARSAAMVLIRRGPESWFVRQIFDDPEGDRDWGLSATVDLAASDEAGEPVLTVDQLGPADSTVAGLMT
jgi:hypothetical protein